MAAVVRKKKCVVGLNDLWSLPINIFFCGVYEPRFNDVEFYEVSISTKLYENYYDFALYAIDYW
jgi:hypothetical protein